VQSSGVAGLIASPGVGLDHTLLNSISACACDAVHWGLLDLAAKVVQPDPEAVVRPSVCPSPVSFVCACTVSFLMPCRSL
jgi:hypothetical protein